MHFLTPSFTSYCGRCSVQNTHLRPSSYLTLVTDTARKNAEDFAGLLVLIHHKHRKYQAVFSTFTSNDDDKNIAALIRKPLTETLPMKLEIVQKPRAQKTNPTVTLERFSFVQSSPRSAGGM